MQAAVAAAQAPSTALPPASPTKPTRKTLAQRACKPGYFLPRIAVSRLADLAFADEPASLKIVQDMFKKGKKPVRGWKDVTLPLRHAMGRLENHINSCPKMDDVKDAWRGKFEATEVYRRLPDTLVEEEFKEEVKIDVLRQAAEDKIVAAKQHMEDCLQKVVDWAPATRAKGAEANRLAILAAVEAWTDACDDAENFYC